LPRLIYAAVAGFMAMGIFSGYRGLTGLAGVPSILSGEGDGDIP
jgi:hypothetical protein